MKRLMPFVGAVAIISTVASASLAAETQAPGQVDFGKFGPPQTGGEFVEVNLNSSLISLAAKVVEKDEPEVARLLNSVQMVRVNVIGLNDDNRADLAKRALKIRKELDTKGWERIVTAQKEDQDVGIFLKTEGKDTVKGVVVMVMDGNKEAVFVNVVGDIKPEQLAMLGDKLHIDPLKKAGKAWKKQKVGDEQQ
jgi:hypothetical protein